MDIIPAILTSDPKELEEKVKLSEGLAERVQIDIVDGIFADNKTIGISEISSLQTSLKLDAQLMVKEPIDWVEGLANAGIARVIGHIEMMANQEEFISQVQERGKVAGLAIDLLTSVSEISPIAMENVGVILIMSVKAGFGGQDFEEIALEKIREIKKIRENKGWEFQICADGGINQENIKKIQDAGADEVIIGHSLYDGDIAGNLRNFQQILISNY